MKAQRAVKFALACLPVLALSACVDAGSGLTIVQNQVPTVASSSPGTPASCMVPNQASLTANSMGTYDVALDRSYPYFMYPLVHNSLPTIMGSTVDPNLIEINKWSVKIEAPPTVTVPWTPDCPAEFDFPSPLILHPTQEAAPVVQAMRPCHGDLLRQLMAAGKISAAITDSVVFRLIVRAKGRHGSTEIKSDPFEFPVRVCYGCLQTGFSGADFADFNFPKIPECTKLATNPFQGNPCNIAQDLGLGQPAMPVLCCALDTAGKQIECPGVPRGMTSTTMP